MTEHTGCITRLATNQDVPHLKSLWKTVFGDEDSDIDHFFSTYFSPELTVVIHDHTKPVSVAYILPVGQLVLTDGERLECAMIYAIATLPEYRGHGYGEAVTREAEELAVQKGFPAVVLKPADDGLFDFYTKRSAFREFFDAFVAEFADTELLSYDPRYTVSPVFPSEYRCLRQNVLDGSTFIDMDERSLSYQFYLSAKSGGGLYALLYEGKSAGCAVIEQDEGVVRIKELLLSGCWRMIDAVSALAQLLPAKKYEVRSLSDFGNPEKGDYRRIAMISRRPDISSVNTAKWYGLAFD